MITLARGRATVMLEPDLWETLQTLARQQGWRPVGAPPAQGMASRYGAAGAVMARDARSLARALQRLVNSESMDGGEVDLAPLVALVNFLRGGAFEIRA